MPVVLEGERCGIRQRKVFIPWVRDLICTWSKWVTSPYLSIDQTSIAGPCSPLRTYNTTLPASIRLSNNLLLSQNNIINLSLVSISILFLKVKTFHNLVWYSNPASLDLRLLALQFGSGPWDEPTQPSRTNDPGHRKPLYSLKPI